jgi:hypothetical protein
MSLPSLKSLLLHDMKLSGTVPATRPCIEPTANCTNATLQTLSLALNYFTGTTDALEKQTNLTTLLLSSNRFSCEAADLDAAEGLAKGNWADPTDLALEAAGREIEEALIIVGIGNPYAGIGTSTNQANTALSFAGNMQARLNLLLLPPALMLWFVQLLRKSAYIPLTPLSRLLQEDVTPSNCLAKCALSGLCVAGS